MKPMSRVDIIVGKLKPTANKPTMRMERHDPMMSKDFVQKVDMSEHDMMMESAGEAIMQAIKQHDAKALAQALCDLMEMHENGPEEHGEGSHFNEEEDVGGGDSEEEEAY